MISCWPASSAPPAHSTVFRSYRRFRHHVENLFQRLKCFRSVETRYDKSDLHFRGKRSPCSSARLAEIPVLKTRPSNKHGASKASGIVQKNSGHRPDEGSLELVKYTGDQDLFWEAEALRDGRRGKLHWNVKRAQQLDRAAQASQFAGGNVCGDRLAVGHEARCDRLPTVPCRNQRRTAACASQSSSRRPRKRTRRLSGAADRLSPRFRQP